MSHEFVQRCSNVFSDVKGSLTSVATKDPSAGHQFKQPLQSTGDL